MEIKYPFESDLFLWRLFLNRFSTMDNLKKKNARENKALPDVSSRPQRIKYRAQQVLCALFLSSLDTDLLLLASLAKVATTGMQREC